MTRNRYRVLRVALTAAAAGALVAGCVTIPSSGPVHSGGAISAGTDDPFTRIVAQPPVPGMTARQVVEGFLHASASFDDNHAVARLFLTSEAGRSWKADSGAKVYDDSSQLGPVLFTAPAPDMIRFAAPQTGQISAQGEFVSAAKGAQIAVSFRLARVGGQWRISALPSGLLLSSNDVARAYRSYDVYFPDPTRTVVVPEQVLVPVGPGISTSLVRAVLAGPTPWLSPAVRTAVPPGTKLVVDSAPVLNGLVQIDLTSPAAAAAGREAAAMSAQFVWTLRQLSDVTTVRITVDGVPLRAPGVGDVQSIQGWSAFDPDAGSANSTAVAVSGARVVAIRGTAPQPVRGPFGTGSVPVTAPVSSYDQTELAGLADAGHRLLVTGVTDGSTPLVALTGTALTAPSWDRQGAVWTVDHGPLGDAVWAVTPGSGPRRATIANAPRGRILALRLARDGVRVVVLMLSPAGGTDVYLGRVQRDGGHLVLAGFRLVNTGFAQTSAVAWQSADRLVVLSRDKVGDVAQPWLIDLDGTRVQAFGPVTTGTQIVAVTAAPTRPVLVSTADGRLWWYSGFEWDLLGRGADPAYSG